MLVFILGLLVRGLYLVESQDNPTFTVPIVDSFEYDRLARGLVDGGGLTREMFWQPLFYPLFLSGVYSFSGSSILCARIFQVLLGAITCVLAFHLGARIFGRSVGLIGGLIIAVYMPLVFFEGELLATGWAAFWSVCILSLLMRARENPAAASCLALGLCGALSIVTRPVFLPFFVAAVLWLSIDWLRRRTGARKMLAAMLWTGMGTAVILVPVVVASCKTIHGATFLPLSGGINFFIGNNPDSGDTIVIRPGAGWRGLTEMPARDEVAGGDEPESERPDLFEQDRWFYERAKEYIVSRPLDFLSGIGAKALQFASSRETPRNLDIYLFRRWSSLLGAGVWRCGPFGFPFGILLPLVAIGALFHWRRIPVAVRLFLVIYPVSVILVFVAARYRMPIIPLFCILAGAGIHALFTAVRNRNVRFLTTSGLLAAAILAVGCIGPYPEENRDYESEFHFVLGSSLQERGRQEEAVSAYENAIGLNDRYDEAYINLGTVLTILGRHEEADEKFLKAIEISPDNPVAHFNRGVCLEDRGMIPQAIEEYREALNLDPRYGRAREALRQALSSR